MPTSAPPQPPRKRCFDPVIDQHTRLLILGSLPSEKSLASQQYYGNPQNRFWALMSDVVGMPLVALDYPSRLKALQENGIGLWDVVAEAHREGSLDSKIRMRSDNDLCALLSHHPNIEAIAFNGATAAKLGRRLLGEHASKYRIVELPSSSPAYTLSYASKAEQWQSLRLILSSI